MSNTGIPVRIPPDAYKVAKEEAPKARQSIGGYFASLIDEVKKLRKEITDLKKKA